MKHYTLLYILYVLLALPVLTACQETLEERCEREAREFTEKKCPYRVNETTVMDSMSFDRASLTLTYSYTLNGLLDDSAVVARNSPHDLLLSELKNSTELRLYKEAGYNIRYTFLSASRKGRMLYDTTFKQADYARQ